MRAEFMARDRLYVRLRSVVVMSASMGSTDSACRKLEPVSRLPCRGSRVEAVGNGRRYWPALRAAFRMDQDLGVLAGKREAES